MNSKPVETQPGNGGVGQDKSDGTKPDKHPPVSGRRIIWVHCFALLLSLALFYFHVVVIIDVIGKTLRYKAWLLEHLGPKAYRQASPSWLLFRTHVGTRD